MFWDCGNWYLYYKGRNLHVIVLYIVLLVAIISFQYNVIRYGLAGETMGMYYLDDLQKGNLPSNLYSE